MYSATDTQTNAFHGVEGLLDYFRLGKLSVPREVTTFQEAVDFLNDETNLILIPTSLEGDWYRTAAGPYLVQDQEGIDLAVLPDWRGRCYFRDEGTGQRVYLNGEIAKRFSKAYSVVSDFPGASVSAPGAVRRMLREVSWYEGTLLLIWSLLGGGLWVLLAEQVRSTLSGVILTAERGAFWSGAASILLLSLLEAVLVLSGRQVIRRAAQKGALAVLLGIGGRLYGTGKPNPETAGGLASLRGSAEQMMTWLLTALWGLPAVLAALAGLWSRPSGKIAGVLAAVLYAAAATVFLIRARRQVSGRARMERWEWLAGQAADRRLGNQRPFPTGWEQRDAFRIPGAAWHIAALLTLPVIFLAVEDGGSSPARLVQAMLLYLAAVALPLGTLLESRRAGRAMAEIRALLQRAEKQEADHVPLPPKGSIFELKDVTFAYPGRREAVLQGVNLRLHPGETVGILGATGAGKTTLARLMTGLLRPTGGNIYYGGIELARYYGRSLRRRVACEQGTDILLCRQLPARRDGRTCVVFSSREEALDGCDRILRLTHGVLIQE